MEYTSIGKGNAALTTGIIGATGFGLNLLGNLLGMNSCGNGCAANGAACGYGYNYGCGPADHPVSRYEAGKDARIAELETEVKLRDANFYTSQEMGKLRDYVDRRFEDVHGQLCHQAVINSQVSANLSCMQGQIATFQGLTKTVIPIDSICPEAMRRYNSWTAPTVPAEEAGTGA